MLFTSDLITNHILTTIQANITALKSEQMPKSLATPNSVACANSPGLFNNNTVQKGNKSLSETPTLSMNISYSSPFNTQSTERGDASKAPDTPLAEGVFGTGHHEHDKWDFWKNRRDKNNLSPGDPAYNPRTWKVPPEFVKNQTPAMSQWLQFKVENMDTVIFFKVGKFYELFHMDADIGMRELDLIYMKGEKAHR